MSNFLDPTLLIKTTGYIGVFTFVTLESGFFLGFFLPGDSLLFTAGLLASQGLLSIWLLIPLSIFGAILGDTIGFYTGHKFGARLFNHEKSLIFSPKRIHEAHEFFETQGPKSLILARFIPAIRTFTPIVAGVADMKYGTFVRFNAIGGTLWGALLPILGFTLGKSIPNIDQYLLPIIALIVVISLLPVIIKVIHSHRKKRRG